jgi:hypothetical protein
MHYAPKLFISFVLLSGCGSTPTTQSPPVEEFSTTSENAYFAGSLQEQSLEVTDEVRNSK